MSSHRRRAKRFSRDFNARKALITGAAGSLIEHGKIRTTVERAKEIRRYTEKLVTLGKKQDLASFRLLVARLSGNVDQARKLFKEISTKFIARPGGYTRITKIGPRAGDKAPMAVLEFIE
jgi:large subunit ribosomal protein L17